MLLVSAITAAVVLTNLVDFEADGERIGLLNANVDSSWSHRATAATLLLGGGLAALRSQRAARCRRWWAATAAALILLFAVEVSPVHVQVDRLSFGKLVYIPLLACLVVCAFRVLAASDQAAVMWVGLSALGCSYAVHTLGPHAVQALGWGADSWAYQVKVGLKEGTELSGWLLLVLALWQGDAARRDGSRYEAGRGRGGPTPRAT